MVTIIIPTWNEEKNIAKLEGNLRELEGDFEVIFSDGFSSDRSFEIITMNKIQETKYRSKQMNAAAKYAKGEYLWFLHADSIIDKKSILDIENSKAEVGCFTLKFNSKNPLLKIIAFNSNLRVKTRNIAFGDQGIFIKKELFDEIGAFKEISIMEDYRLSMDLKARGYKIKQLKREIITSARRFLDKGILKTMVKMQILQYKYRHGYDTRKIYDLYEK